MEEVGNISKKYRLPNVMLHHVRPEYLASAVKKFIFQSEDLSLGTAVEVHPNWFKSKLCGDRWCLFDVCERRDSYYHVRFECKSGSY